MALKVIGHRGALGIEPENTLRSFRRAQELGVDEIEFDLHLSSDGHLVVMHDLDVDRTTNGSGPVASFTLDGLKGLDAGMGEQVPTFEEVLDVVTAPIQAEVKAVSAARATVETVVRRGIADRVTVSSFHADAIDAAKTRSIELLGEPGIRTGLIFATAPSESVERAKAVRADVLSLRLAPLTASLVKAAHDADLEVIAWTANAPEHLLQAIRLGADAIATDFPTLLADTVRALPDIRAALNVLERLEGHESPLHAESNGA